jgi:hypothetical protein
MLQRSKLIGSRDEWKCKAVQRADEIRELKKTRKRLKGKITVTIQHLPGSVDHSDWTALARGPTYGSRVIRITCLVGKDLGCSSSTEGAE